MIVFGSHGSTGLASPLMGSVTEKVIGHASCPVLVVRQSRPPRARALMQDR